MRPNLTCALHAYPCVKHKWGGPVHCKDYIILTSSIANNTTPKEEEMFKLGKKVPQVTFLYANGQVLRDKISGLEGVVMVRCHYATGCLHYGIQRKGLKEDGSTYSWEYFDQSQVEPVEEGESVSFDIKPGNTSGPMPNAPRR